MSPRRAWRALGLDSSRPLLLVRYTEDFAETKDSDEPFFAATDGLDAAPLQVEGGLSSKQRWTFFLDRFSVLRPGLVLPGPALLTTPSATVRIIANQSSLSVGASLRVTATTAGLEENRLVAQARGMAQHAAVVEELRKQAVAAWSPEVRSQIPAAPPEAVGPQSPVLIFRDSWALAVIAIHQGWDVVVQVDQQEPAAWVQARSFFGTLCGAYSNWVVGHGALDVSKAIAGRGWTDRPRQEIRTSATARRMLGLREEDLPPDVGTALARTRDYFNAQQAGLESGA